MSPFSDSEKRVAALRQYEIMDTRAETAFDDITRLASFICATPIALVTLLDTTRQWFKSKVGVEVSSTPIEVAFCAHAVSQEEILIVPDTMLDERFASNPLVTADPKIRFYAGAQLVTPEGVALGTLCAIDRVPRGLWPEQIEALQALARQVMQMLELRKTVIALKAALAANDAAERKIEALQQLIPMCSWCRKICNETGDWQTVENYIATNSGNGVSHGICPECAEAATRGCAKQLKPLTAAK